MPDEHRAFIDNKEISLTHKEFELLLFFYLHQRLKKEALNTKNEKQENALELERELSR